MIPPRLSLPLLLLALAAALPGATRDQTLAIEAQVTPEGWVRLLMQPARAQAVPISCTVMRKLPSQTAWTLLGSTASGAPLEYLDSAVQRGLVYEYRVQLKASTATADGAAVNNAAGFCAAAVEVPAPHDRGRVILVVEQSLPARIPKELALFEQDLRGDGWTVHRLLAPRHVAYPGGSAAGGVPADKRLTMASNPAAILRERIRQEIIAAGEDPARPASFRHVILLGKVQIPYSGLQAPDGHVEHLGAWPADCLYGDLTSALSDNSVSYDAATGRQDNFPGDGKFDQSYLDLDGRELSVGRISLHDMPDYTWKATEHELLARYLRKDHAWRHHRQAAQARGLMSTQWDDDKGPHEAWRTYPQLFGWAGTRKVGSLYGTAKDPGAFKRELRAGTWTWAVSHSYAGNTHTSWVKTEDYATGNLKAVFFAHFGSWHGDWDQTNNLLRACLAQKDWGLASHWGARPHVSYQQMAAGWTLGESWTQSLNQSAAYAYPSGGSFARAVHPALMGDPTLRLHPLAPPDGLTATAVAGGVRLTWAASEDPVAGYHIYRAHSATGAFVRLDGALVTGTSWTDASPLPIGTAACYQVRAATLVRQRAGAYWNLSQGIFSQGIQAVPWLEMPPAATVQGLGSILAPLQAGDDRPAAGLTWKWNRTSGPGTATFAAPDARSSAVEVSLPGTYVFSLTLSDGTWSVTRSCTVTYAVPTGIARQGGPEPDGAG